MSDLKFTEQKPFLTFLAGFQTKYWTYMATTFPTLFKDQITVKEGRRYIKILLGSSVNVFIDKKTGDVLKPASWRAPAKGRRGNIFNADNGLGCISESGSVAYLR